MAPLQKEADITQDGLVFVWFGLRSGRFGLLLKSLDWNGCLLTS